MGAAVLGPGWQGAAGGLLLPPPGGDATALDLVERALDEARLLQAGPLPPTLALAPGEWRLGASELRAMAERCHQRGVRLTALCSDDPRTRVAAAAIGLQTCSPAAGGGDIRSGLSSGGSGLSSGGNGGLSLQRGTLRSGDHLEAEGSVLVLGDVNPGGRVSAGGHVLVWGRLRGVAHAGRHGDASARIVALQLRPLQLRIAEAVARGPEDSPPEGLAEQASLVDGVIRLDPAPPVWPLAPDWPPEAGAGGRRFGLNLPRPRAQP